MLDGGLYYSPSKAETRPNYYQNRGMNKKKKKILLYWKCFAISGNDKLKKHLLSQLTYFGCYAESNNFALSPKNIL